jgi:hypothetical protein
MTLKAEDISVLYDATPPDEIKQRQGPRKHQGDCPKFGPCPQPHMMLDYVDARYVMDKLDRLGPENWQDQFVDRSDGSVRCGIGLHIGDEWIWKWDVGTVSDIEPEKGAYSEAFKRAGVKWGVARDLYGHRAGTSKRPAPARATQTPAPVQVTPTDEDDFTAALDSLVAGGSFRADAELAFATNDLEHPANDEPSHANTSTCPKHNVPWKGNPGDLYHKLESGGYCRPEGQPRKAR